MVTILDLAFVRFPIYKIIVLENLEISGTYVSFRSTLLWSGSCGDLEV